MQTKEQIPILDLAPEIDGLWEELNEAVQRVMRSGRFIMGPEVRQFEEETAAYLGAQHAVGVNSGTDALVIALRALDVGPGDEVITTPFTFFATAESISMVGAEPVFVDVEPKSFDLDPSKIEAALTPRTKALMPVHLYGGPAAMAQIMALAEAHDLKVVEDCAQSFGARFQGQPVGTLGDAGAFSFFPTKNLGAYGDGGLVVTDDAALAEEARMLRTHGSKKKYQNEVLGYNSRLDALQAAILRVKLPHLDAYNERRRAVARRYNEALRDLASVKTPALAEGHVFHQYTVRLLGGCRDAVRVRLDEAGISTMVYYPVSCHRLPVYADKAVTLPVAEALEEQVLSLPIWPQMSEAVQEQIIKKLKAILRRS